MKRIIGKHPVATTLLSALVCALVAWGIVALIGLPLWAQLVSIAVTELLGAFVGLQIARKCTDD